MKSIRTIILLFLVVVSLHARQEVNINFSNLQIMDFIKLVSKVTHKNILISSKINGTVDFVSTTPVYDDELMNILVSVLESKGYTIVPKGSIYEVVRSIDGARHNAKIVEDGKKLSGAFMVTQAIKIENENVDVIAAKIRHLISKTAKLITMKESNTLLITDYPKNIQTIKKIIQDLEKKQASIVKIVPVKHTDAKQLQKKLSDIVKSIFNATVKTETVKIIYDENSNGLIVVGARKNVQKVIKLIHEMDVESHVNKKLEIFNLKNSDAKEVLKTLTDIIAKQTYADPSLKPNVAMSSDINAIIAIGDPMILKAMKLVIDELDKEKYQVYVQAKIVEINKNKSSDIGIKYGFAAGDVSSSGLYAMSANFGSQDLTQLASKSVLDYLGTIGSNIGSAFALGATLDFLQIHGASKSISNPSILCVNNKESSIYVGKTISISSGQTAVAGSTTTSYKREDVGLTLKIKPRVSSKDKVTLDVEAVLENILDDGSQNATKQPVTSKQEVKTQAILRNGESIIIGGLLKSYERDAKNKVPLLGDIPYLGDALFASTSKTNEQDNLVVILTPYVIDKSKELSKLQRALGMLAKVQEEYNKKAFELVEEKREVKLKPEESAPKVDIFHNNDRR